MTGDPRSEVFSTVAWDGGMRLLAADLHFSRFQRHSERLGIILPENIPQLVFQSLAEAEIPGEPVVGDDQAPYLIKIGIDSTGEVHLTPRVNGK